MNTELIRVSAGRQPVIETSGGRVFVAVHDEYYRRTWRAWKNTLKLAHPDMHHQRRPVEVKASRRCRAYTQERRVSGPHRASWATRFRSLRRRFDTWKKQEAAWYAHHQLEPPQW